MPKIKQIIGTEFKGNDVITYALMDDGEEASGWGKYDIGQEVEVFLHQRYNKIKFRPVKEVKASGPPLKKVQL